MASSKAGQVTLNGRFSPGAHVALWKVRDETALRHEGGELVDTKKVDDDGRVQFKSGVEVGARYFIVGYQDGSPLEVRARGRSADDDNGILAQPPVKPDRVRLANGRWADEAPKRESAPSAEVGPSPAQHQVPAGTQQRSDTPLGTATPVDPKERPPFPGQDDVAKNADQRSDTELGQATPVVHGAPPAQADVKDGTPQRSDTERGTAAPIPAGDAVKAALDRDNAETKAAIGEPVKAAATPASVAKKPAKAKSASKPRAKSQKRSASKRKK